MSAGLDIIRKALSRPLCELSVARSRCTPDGYLPGAGEWDARKYNCALHRFTCGAEAIALLPVRKGNPPNGMARLPCPTCAPDLPIPRGHVLLRVCSAPARKP